MVRTIISGFVCPTACFKFLFKVIFCFTISNSSYCQIVQSDNNLNFMNSGSGIENIINIYTTRTNYENIKITPGRKISIKAAYIVINGDSIIPERINTRGQTTLGYRRKSFSFSLETKAAFHHRGKTESFKKFFALSLSMDRIYINNRIAFEMMETLSLFHLYYTFCELRINDQSEGVYMIMERPEDWAIKKNNSPVMLRRGYNEDIVKTEINKNITKDEIKIYRSNYRKIYSSLSRYEGEELYKTLSGLIDLDSYMRWLAFNFYVHNSDYTDEVYLYIDPQNKKFNIIPWDYDDLFSKAPHEGYGEGRKLQGEKLIFSAEDLLDQKIASDPFLYKVYLTRFRELLGQLSPDVIKKTIENTFTELYPYYINQEIIGMSKSDRYPNANLDNLKDYLTTVYTHLIATRNFYLNYLESRIN